MTELELALLDLGRALELPPAPDLASRVAARIEPAEVNGQQGIWLTGAPHLFVFPGAPPRLAGNVLIWQRGGLTLRLEGRLTKAQAVELAQGVG